MEIPKWNRMFDLSICRRSKSKLNWAVIFCDDGNIFDSYYKTLVFRVRRSNRIRPDSDVDLLAFRPEIDPEWRPSLDLNHISTRFLRRFLRNHQIQEKFLTEFRPNFDVDFQRTTFYGKFFAWISTKSKSARNLVDLVWRDLWTFNFSTSSNYKFQCIRWSSIGQPWFRNIHFL